MAQGTQTNRLKPPNSPGNSRGSKSSKSNKNKGNNNKPWTNVPKRGRRSKKDKNPPIDANSNPNLPREQAKPKQKAAAEAAATAKAKFQGSVGNKKPGTSSLKAALSAEAGNEEDEYDQLQKIADQAAAGKKAAPNKSAATADIVLAATAKGSASSTINMDVEVSSVAGSSISKLSNQSSSTSGRLSQRGPNYIKNKRNRDNKKKKKEQQKQQANKLSNYYNKKPAANKIPDPPQEEEIIFEDQEEDKMDIDNENQDLHSTQQHQEMELGEDKIEDPDTMEAEGSRRKSQEGMELEEDQVQDADCDEEQESTIPPTVTPQEKGSSTSLTNYHEGNNQDEDGTGSTATAHAGNTEAHSTHRPRANFLRVQVRIQKVFDIELSNIEKKNEIKEMIGNALSVLQKKDHSTAIAAWDDSNLPYLTTPEHITDLTEGDTSLYFDNLTVYKGNSTHNFRIFLGFSVPWQAMDDYIQNSLDDKVYSIRKCAVQLSRTHIIGWLFPSFDSGLPIGYEGVLRQWTGTQNVGLIDQVINIGKRSEPWDAKRKRERAYHIIVGAEDAGKLKHQLHKTFSTNSLRFPMNIKLRFVPVISETNDLNSTAKVTQMRIKQGDLRAIDPTDCDFLQYDMLPKENEAWRHHITHRKLTLYDFIKMIPAPLQVKGHTVSLFHMIIRHWNESKRGSCRMVFMPRFKEVGERTTGALISCLKHTVKTWAETSYPHDQEMSKRALQKLKNCFSAKDIFEQWDAPWDSVNYCATSATDEYVLSLTAEDIDVEFDIPDKVLKDLNLNGRQTSAERAALAEARSQASSSQSSSQETISTFSTQATSSTASGQTIVAAQDTSRRRPSRSTEVTPSSSQTDSQLSREDLNSLLRILHKAKTQGVDLSQDIQSYLPTPTNAAGQTDHPTDTRASKAGGRKASSQGS